MDKFNYKIMSELGVLSENKDKGTTRELNIISWNNRYPKVDIRDWGENHEMIGKGITLTFKECCILCDLFFEFVAEMVKAPMPEK